MLFKVALILALAAAIPSTIAAKAPSKDWWETASFYQIYPRSFKDSDGDGVGDLKGVTQNLDYLKEIGVTATWLSPIFKSPMADFGYDISNFTDIDPLFGNMNDFDELIVQAKKKGIKIILDFVPNHTSDEHEWFQKSIKRDPLYKDFYVWAPGRLVNGVRQPPSNWVSVFRGSAWEWNEERGEYYLHQFHKKQPDLNFRNPKVHDAMREVLEFWLKKGAAGFRIDAVQHSYEIRPELDGNFLNEPRNREDSDEESYGYTQHVFTVDQRETTEMIYSWRKVMDDFKKKFGGDTRILMAESYSPIEVVSEYYGEGDIDGAHIPFNFLMLQWLNENSNARDYDNAINTWLSHMPEGKTANWVMGNHDKNRVGSRLGKDRIDLINTVLATLPGCSITYQGEEIGMTDVFISWEDTVDPQACNSNPDIFQWFSRDPARTPFQWNTSKNAGFSNATNTWLPVSSDYKTINVESERKVADSHLNLYKELHNLRQKSTFINGEAQVKALNQNVLAIRRSLKGDYTYITLVNIWDEFEFIDLSVAFPETTSSEFEYVFVNRRSQHSKKDKTKPYSITLMPKEAVVLKSKKIE